MKFINKNEFFLDSYQLTAQDYYDKKKEYPKPIVLDIRPAEQSEMGMIDGAYVLPADTLEERLIQLPPFGVIILYSDRENTYIEESMYMLWENGFADIYYVDGGYETILENLITFTKKAEQNIDKWIEQYSPQMKAIKIDLKGQDYSLSVVSKTQEIEHSFSIEKHSLKIYFLHRFIRLVEGATIDFEKDNFTIDHPRMHEERRNGNIKEQVSQILEEKINPMVAMHGGVISLLDVKDDKVYIEMGGGCQGCGMSAVTLKQGIETAIKDNFPEINEILDITDHAAGTNPYYKPT